jgi:hypothetical protein
MKQELQDKIFEDFPELFELRRPRKEGEKVMPSICYGLECGDGWYDLIYTLCSQIANYIKWNEKDCKVQVLQVKEKFGGLRFYTNAVPDKIRGMINMAEAMSYKICDVCGNKGSINSSNGGCCFGGQE